MGGKLSHLFTYNELRATPKKRSKVKQQAISLIKNSKSLVKVIIVGNPPPAAKKAAKKKAAKKGRRRGRSARKMRGR